MPKSPQPELLRFTDQFNCTPLSGVCTRTRCRTLRSSMFKWHMWMARLTCAGSSEHAMHRLCQLRHVVCLKRRPSCSTPGPVIATSPKWGLHHELITGMGWLQCGLRGAFLGTLDSGTTRHFARPSSVIVPRVSMLCVFCTPRSSTRLFGQAERCCCVQQSNVPDLDGFQFG